MFPASSSSERVSFRQINKSTGNRLKQQLVDSVTGDVVEAGQKGRGYEIGRNQYMPVEDEELESLRLESTHTRGFIADRAVEVAPRCSLYAKPRIFAARRRSSCSEFTSRNVASGVTLIRSIKRRRNRPWPQIEPRQKSEVFSSHWRFVESGSSNGFPYAVVSAECEAREILPK
jgi:hypothetical protein